MYVRFSGRIDIVAEGAAKLGRKISLNDCLIRLQISAVESEHSLRQTFDLLLFGTGKVKVGDRISGYFVKDT